MNRIKQKTTQSLGGQKSLHIDTSKLHSSKLQRPRFSTFSPLHYEPNYAYPLLVWLHGPNDDDRQLQQIMPLVSMRNYVAIAPRGNRALEVGFTWDHSPQGMTTTTNAVFDCISSAKEKFNIAPDRIFIGGYQQGGTAAFRVGLNHPESFAGILSVAGPFPEGQTPLRHLDRLRTLPMFIAHGRDSELYPVEQTCEELRLFHAGGLSLTLRQYPVADELDSQMLRDMDVWMMELVTGQSSSDSEASCLPFNELN